MAKTVPPAWPCCWRHRLRACSALAAGNAKYSDRHTGQAAERPDRRSRRPALSRGRTARPPRRRRSPPRGCLCGPTAVPAPCGSAVCPTVRRRVPAGVLAVRHRRPAGPARSPPLPRDGAARRQPAPGAGAAMRRGWWRLRDKGVRNRTTGFVALCSAVSQTALATSIPVRTAQRRFAGKGGPLPVMF